MYKRSVTYSTKEKAILASKEFIREVNELEKKYGLSFNSDSGDVYLSVRVKGNVVNNWDSIELGWTGDGSGIKVIEEVEENKKKAALSKLTEEEKDILGIA